VIGRRWYVPWFFLLPTLVVQTAFLWLPLGNTFVLAFTNADTLGGGTFNGVDNFARLAGDAAFWSAMRNSALYVVVVVPVTLVLSLLLALLLNSRLFGAGFVRTLTFSPVVTPMVVIALVWGWTLDADGLLNFVLARLRLVHEPVGWLTEPHLALLSLMAVTVWRTVGFYAVLYLAALQNVPRELVEASQVDGAGLVRRTVSVVVPLLRPTTFLVATLSAIAALRVFTEPYVITGGGPYGSTETVVFYLLQTGVSPGSQAGYASAISLFLFAVIVVAALGLRLFARWRAA
jgi:putative chitobiose transport system permease protein